MIESLAAVAGRISEIQRMAGPAVAPSVSFADTLQSARRAAAAEPSGRVRSAAPAELAPYGNGMIPDVALTPVGQSHHRLWGPAAQAFRQMESAAARDGVRLDVSDSYRSYDEQVDVARRKGLYRDGGLAAEPGTSTHGWGLSVDLATDDGTLGWLRANAARYGFVEDVAREPWHWTYNQALTAAPAPDPLARLGLRLPGES